MVTDIFASLLDDLGRVLRVEGLHPDERNTCLLKLKTGVHVQMEIDPEGKYLIIGSDLGDVPPGKYREQLFREALMANGIPSPRYGILAYSHAINHLILFERLPVKNLTGNQIADVLEPFSQKAELWRDALARGQIPQSAAAKRPTGTPGLFGLKP